VSKRPAADQVAGLFVCCQGAGAGVVQAHRRRCAVLGIKRGAAGGSTLSRSQSISTWRARRSCEGACGSRRTSLAAPELAHEVVAHAADEDEAAAGIQEQRRSRGHGRQHTRQGLAEDFREPFRIFDLRNMNNSKPDDDPRSHPHLRGGWATGSRDEIRSAGSDECVAQPRRFHATLKVHSAHRV
jgi:hypothetical protein